MRLLVITNDFPPNPGGIENYIYSLVRRWPPEDVVVVTRRMPGSEAFDAAQGFEVIREPVDTLLPAPGLVRRLNALAGDRKIDMVHFPSALPLGLMGEGLARPYAVSVHGGEFVLASRLPGARTALKAVCRKAAVLLPESSFAESLVTRLLGPDVPMARVTCGVDIDRYAPGAAEPVPLEAKGPVVVSVSRLVARKGGRTLLRAFPRVLESHPDAHLVIVGGGPDFERLQKMTERAGLRESVTLPGPQPWDRIPAWLAAADIFALPTRTRFLGTETEGLPLVYVEAAAAGLPLIGAEVGGVGDAVRPGETGIMVDGSDPAETAGAICRLLDDPAEAGRLGSAARAMAERDFSWDSIYNLYRKALLNRV
jgi:phosphatidyl-myo-inositol dimannoside synthase